MMRRPAVSAYWSFSLVLGLASQACSPLSNGTNNVTNCLAAATGDNFSSRVGLGQNGAIGPDGIITIETEQLAQSFYVATTTTITQASADLDVVYPVGSGGINGSVALDIEPDNTISTSSPTATVPAGITSSLGHNTVTAASLPTQAQGAAFSTFSVGSITLVGGQIYWVVLTPTYTPSSTSYVEWRAGTETIPYEFAEYMSFPTLVWTSLGTSRTFAFKVGC